MKSFELVSAPARAGAALRHRRLWWVRAQLIDPPDSAGLSLAAVRDRIEGPGLRFAIELACGADGFVALADPAFTELIPGEQERHHDVVFDPVRHTAPDVTVWPEWLRDVREAAYSGSRQGRANHPLLS